MLLSAAMMCHFSFPGNFRGISFVMGALFLLVGTAQATDLPSITNAELELLEQTAKTGSLPPEDDSDRYDDTVELLWAFENYTVADLQHIATKADFRALAKIKFEPFHNAANEIAVTAVSAAIRGCNAQALKRFKKAGVKLSAATHRPAIIDEKKSESFECGGGETFYKHVSAKSYLKATIREYERLVKDPDHDAGDAQFLSLCKESLKLL